MKLKTVCQICGKLLTEVEKPIITDLDVLHYEKTVKCQDHGGNSYVYNEIEVEIFDENGQSYNPPQFSVEKGELISSTITVKAFRILE